MMCYDGIIINRATLWMYRHRLVLVRVSCAVLCYIPPHNPREGRDGCCCCKHCGQVAGEGLMVEMGVEGK